MKIGVIGLGNIAQKAYLPIMMTKHPDIDWHLCTRNEEKLKRIGQQYRINNLHTSVESLVSAGVDAAFVHAPTTMHGEVIRKLLNNKIDVYVDKPVSENIDETKALYELAEKQKCLLMAGFNRRYAPMVKKLKSIEDKNLLIIQKNRASNNKKETTFMIYDIFIHPLDTALYLLDEEVEQFSSRVIEKDGKLQQVWAMIETKSSSCLVSVNVLAGANNETMEVQSPSGIAKVDDLSEYHQIKPNSKQVETFPDWEHTLTKRGFVPIIQEFIEAVENKKESPISYKSSIQSHEYCQKILDESGIE